MDDERDLDEFSKEQPAVATPAAGEAADRDTLRIVVADEQLAAPWETFPAEERTQLEPADAPLPPLIVALQQNARRSLLVPAALVLTVAIVLVGQRMMTKEVHATPPAAARPATAARPASAAPARKTVSAAVPAVPIVSSPAISRAAPETSTRNAVSGERRLRPVGTTARAAARPPAATRSTPAPRVLAPVPRAIVKKAPNPTAAALATPISALPAPVAAAPPPREEPRASEAPALPPAAVSVPAPAPESTLTPETRAVLSALDRYQQAYSALDANAVHAVWPSVDVKALDRAFGQLDEQTFDLKGCDVIVAGARAEAACTGTAIYVGKVGRKAAREESRRWMFTLRQDSDQWVIDRVQVR